jgi:uncharacterized repeat protein (TIGR03803 family)
MFHSHILRSFGLVSVLLLAWASTPATVRGGGLTAIASFNGSNGATPAGGVTFDANGNLYGTSTAGGANNLGTVWELTTGSSTITALASFNGTNGNFAYSGVTFDTNGNVYGTAPFGGANNQGTVWEVAKGSDTITVLASFNRTSGTFPYWGATLDASGNLYGTTYQGGANSVGTVWEFSSAPEPSSLILGLISLAVSGGAVLLWHHRRCPCAQNAP